MVNSYCLIKNKKYINLFAAFDIYYKNKVSYRENKFYNSEGDEDLPETPIYRLNVLNAFVESLNPQNVVNVKDSVNFKLYAKDSVMV